MICFSHVAFMVKDLDRMETFYREIFGMHVLWKKSGDKCYLTTGNYDILGLLEKSDYSREGYPLDLTTFNPNETPNFNHFGIVATSENEFEKILGKAQSMGLEVFGPKKSRDDTISFYFKDPENNPVQVCFTPEGYFSKKKHL